MKPPARQAGPVRVAPDHHDRGTNPGPKDLLQCVRWGEQNCDHRDQRHQRQATQPVGHSCYEADRDEQLDNGQRRPNHAGRQSQVGRQ